MSKLEENNYKYQLLDERVNHLKELMSQREKSASAAIEKTEGNLTSRLEKITGAVENLGSRFDQNIQSVTARYEENAKTINSKIDQLSIHLEEKMLSNLKSEAAKFEAVDKQMKISIDSNAELSNEGLASLNLWRENQQGSMRVIMAVGGFISALVLALLIAFIKNLFN